MGASDRAGEKSRKSTGQTLAEYALILSLLALAAIGAFTTFGNAIPMEAVKTLTNDL